MYLVRRVHVEVKPDKKIDPRINETIWSTYDINDAINTAKFNISSSANTYMRIKSANELLDMRGLVFSGECKGVLGPEYNNTRYKTIVEVFNLEFMARNSHKGFAIEHYEHPWWYYDLVD